MTIHNVVLHSNRTSSSGGGVFSGGADGSLLTITNSTFDSNDAYDGGGLDITGSTTGVNQFSNLYFTNNTAHDGQPLTPAAPSTTR